MKIRTMLRMILVIKTSSSLYPPHNGSLLFPLPAHLSSTSGTLWSKAGLHVHAEAVLAVLDDLRRGDDLLVVVEDDRFSLTSNFHDLHLAWVELVHLPVIIIIIIIIVIITIIIIIMISLPGLGLLLSGVGLKGWKPPG